MKRTNVGAALAIIFCLGTAGAAHGSLSCKMLKLLEAPEFRENASFWEGFAKISAKGEPSEANLLKLLEQHGIKPNSSPARGDSDDQASAAHGSKRKVTLSTPPSAPYSLNSQAAKDLAKIQSQHGLKSKFEEFLKSIPNGAKDLSHLKDHSNGWKLEKLSSAQFGEHHYSVRLNQGYRVVFEAAADGQVVIKHISKTVTHSN